MMLLLGVLLTPPSGSLSRQLLLLERRRPNASAAACLFCRGREGRSRRVNQPGQVAPASMGAGRQAATVAAQHNRFGGSERRLRTSSRSRRDRLAQQAGWGRQQLPPARTGCVRAAAHVRQPARLRPSAPPGTSSRRLAHTRALWIRRCGCCVCWEGWQWWKVGCGWVETTACVSAMVG